MYTFTFNNYQLMANYQFISFSDSVFSENKARTKTSEDRPLSGEICVSVHQVGVKHRVNHKNELKIWSVTLLNGFTSLETTSQSQAHQMPPTPPPVSQTFLILTRTHLSFCNGQTCLQTGKTVLSYLNFKPVALNCKLSQRIRKPLVGKQQILHFYQRKCVLNKFLIVLKNTFIFRNLKHFYCSKILGIDLVFLNFNISLLLLSNRF